MHVTECNMNSDKHYLCAWSAACVDFVSSYEKIGVTKILMNAEMHVNFRLRTVYTQIRSAHVS